MTRAEEIRVLAGMDKIDDLHTTVHGNGQPGHHDRLARVEQIQVDCKAAKSFVPLVVATVFAGLSALAALASLVIMFAK